VSERHLIYANSPGPLLERKKMQDMKTEGKGLTNFPNLLTLTAGGEGQRRERRKTQGKEAGKPRIFL
jgi:hypothetical protein